MSSERRLIFGQAADLYHRYRPTYPEALIEDLVALGGLDGSRAVLEVGAGTGKATALFAARGIPVLAAEPSAEMSSHLRALPGVSVENCDFEDWDPAGRRFPLVYSGQAWHWVRPEVGYAKAASVLDPGGWLAAFWNRPEWSRCELRAELIEAYDATAPDAERDATMHPASSFSDEDGAWRAAIADTAGLGSASARGYEWSLDYTAEEYLGLLATTSELQLWDPGLRSRLLAAVRSVIEERGGLLPLPMYTLLCLARRVG